MLVQEWGRSRQASLIMKWKVEKKFGEPAEKEKRVRVSIKLRQERQPVIREVLKMDQKKPKGTIETTVS